MEIGELPQRCGSHLELALILLKSITDAGGVDGTPSRIEEIP